MTHAKKPEIRTKDLITAYHRFCAFGGTASRFKELLKNDDLMKWWVGRLEEFPPFRLIHDVFSPTTEVLSSFRERCTTKNIDFGRFSWIGSKTPPEFDRNDPYTVVVLDVTLDTLHSTFTFAWEWVIDEQEGVQALNTVDSRSQYLRLLRPPAGPYWYHSRQRKPPPPPKPKLIEPYTLWWRRIKLDVHIDQSPLTFREANSSPGCALLFLMAEHPAWVKDMIERKKTYRGLWLPGLAYDGPESSTPCVQFGSPTWKIHLYGKPEYHHKAYILGPAFHEERME